MPERIVVVGAGLAGARTCAALRGQGYGGALTLVGAEEHRPYDRPPLSKEVLAGAVDDTTLDHPLEKVELLLGRRATAVTPGVLETDGGPVEWDALALATGAEPVRLPGPGTQHVLRTIEDARALRDLLRPGARVVIIGAGWIGAEVATAAANAGCLVTVVEAGHGPLAVALGEIGAATATWYGEAGIDLRVDTAVASVEEGGVALAGGEFVPADVVLTGVGVRPATGWLDGSGVEIDRGVVTDEWLRVTWPDAPGPVVAVGDLAAWWSVRFGTRLRLEHWDDALQAPSVAAATLLGGGSAPHDPVPYVWSDQFGRMLQYAGHRPPDATVVRRGDPAGESWSVCWLAPDGRLSAVFAVGRPKDVTQARKLIAAGVAPDPVRLADPDVALRSLA